MIAQTPELERAARFWTTVLRLLPQLSRWFVISTGTTALTSLAGIAGATASPATTRFFTQLAGLAVGCWMLSIIGAVFAHYLARLDPNEVFNLDGPERWQRNLTRWPWLAKIVSPFGHVTIGGIILSVVGTFLAPAILIGGIVYSFRGEYEKAMFCDAEIRTYLTASTADYVIDGRCNAEFSKRVRLRGDRQQGS